jgi:hypothetical protein
MKDKLKPPFLNGGVFYAINNYIKLNEKQKIT